MNSAFLLSQGLVLSADEKKGFVFANKIQLSLLHPRLMHLSCLEFLQSAF